MKNKMFIPLCLVAVGFLAYYRSLTVPFIFDDVSSVLENPTIRRLWPLWQALTPPQSGTTVTGRPIVNLSFALNYALGENHVWGYHALNLTIHLLAGLTLFGVIRRTLVQPVLRKRFGASALPLAFVAAILWTIHPIQTESVTYIAQRAESLVGLMYLLTLYCFIRGTGSQRPGLWFALAVVACLLGMASKEVMVSAPLMVLLYDRTFVGGSFRAAWQKRWRFYTSLAATWLLLGYLVAGSLDRGGTAGFGTRILWWQYALIQCRAIMHYFRLTIWPHPLVFDYGTTSVGSMTEVAPFVAVILLLLAGTLVALWRWPVIGFAGFWAFAILAPSSSVVPVTTQTIAEHRMYLPMASPIVVVICVLYLIGNHLLAAQPKFARMLGWGAGGVIALLLACLTIQRNLCYSSDLAIWQDTVDKCPENARAQFSLGNALLDAGRLEDAVRHYERAMQIKPNSAEVHNSLGIALAQQDRIGEGIAHFEQASRIEPGFVDPHFNLALLLTRIGRLQEATTQWEQVTRLKPDDADAHNSFGVGLCQLGKAEDAVAQFEQALQIKPDWAEAHYNLGNALLQMGRLKDAAAQYEQAVRLKPDFAEAQRNLVRLRAGQ